MRGMFGLVGLLVALAIVGTLIKKQLNSVSALPPVLPVTPSTASTSAPQGASVQVQSQAIQQQVLQSVESSLDKAQQARDEKQ